MLKKIAIFLLVAGLIVGGYFGYKYYQTKNKSAKPQEKKLNLPNPSFHWGATIRPFALTAGPNDPISPESIPKQISFLKQLGANIARVNLETNFKTNDQIIEGITNNEMNVLLVLEEDVDFNNPDKIDLYQKGRDFGRRIASRYKDRVKYYQLANEVTGTTVHKDEDKGPTMPDQSGLFYDQNRYRNARKYIKGLSEGVHEADPAAKRMVTGNWILVDVIKYLIEDQVNFEIVGWDWYSDMSDEPAIKKLDSGEIMDIPKIMIEHGKEFWLVEANYADGSFNNKESEQAAYIESLATKSHQNSLVKGFIVHTLVNSVGDRASAIGHLGLVTIKQNPDGTWSFGNKKEAFSAYQKVIEQAIGE